MSDIVRRLRLSNGVMLDAEREECAAEIERLRVALVADDDGNAAYQSGWHARDAEIARLREALEFVLEAAQWHFDGNADPKNESPEDMTAHINGLIVQRVREALGE